MHASIIGWKSGKIVKFLALTLEFIYRYMDIYSLISQICFVSFGRSFLTKLMVDYDHTSDTI